MEALRKNHKKLISLKQAKKIVFFLVFILFFDFLLFPAPTMASESVEIFSMQNQGNIADAASETNQQVLTEDFNGQLPESNNVNVKWSNHFVITAYNSDAGQTDGTPCITANNFNVCDNGIEDTVAANFLPFGSKVRIPELFGDRVFVVRDRMNKRFTHRVDVWMIERPDAVKFGVKTAKIEVLE